MQCDNRALSDQLSTSTRTLKNSAFSILTKQYLLIALAKASSTAELRRTLSHDDDDAMPSVAIDKFLLRLETKISSIFDFYRQFPILTLGKSIGKSLAFLFRRKVFGS